MPVFALLLALAAGLAACASSRKTITYSKKRHKCNCPHFTHVKLTYQNETYCYEYK